MEVIQSVVRCLDILHKLSAHNGATLVDIAKSSALPRGTVHRMLETLGSAGYVRKDSHLGGYWLEAKARELGLGYSDQSWILDEGTEAIETLRRHIHWCLTLSVPDGDQMLIRIATRLKNPQGGAKTFAGERKPIGQSSQGHVYLAFCEPGIKEQTLDRLYGDGKSETAFLNNGDAVSPGNARKLLSTIEKQGYALYEPNARVQIVSVPILKDGYAAGAISTTFFISGVTQSQLFNDLLPRMQDASRQISTREASRNGEQRS